MVLFATDIAARGLDFPTVDWVVQVGGRDSPAKAGCSRDLQAGAGSRCGAYRVTACNLRMWFHPGQGRDF